MDRSQQPQVWNYAPSRELPEDALAVWEEIKRHDLGEHIGELAVKGLTVVPPHKIGAPGLADRLRDKILEIAQRRSGRRFDLVKEVDHGGSAPLGFIAHCLLLEDPVFQEAVLNPAALALVDYLVGKNAVIGTCTGLVKGASSSELEMHVDNFITVPPFHDVRNQCNNTFALTDYSEENGALFYVPGSHLYRRPPMPGEGLQHRKVVAAEAGSLIVWDGALWHGALERKAPGVRVSLSFTMMRPNIRPYEDYSRAVTQEILDRNPPRFTKIVGKHVNLGWYSPDGPPGDGAAFGMGRHPYE